MTLLVGLEKLGYEVSEAGMWSRWRSTAVCGSRACRWQAVQTYRAASAPRLALLQRLSLKVRESLRLLPFADFCERNDMLQRHNHQGNCGPAPGTSDPDNLSGLHQQLTSHLHQAQQKSSVRLILFAFTPRPAPREQLLSRGKGKVAWSCAHRDALCIHNLHFIGYRQHGYLIPNKEETWDILRKAIQPTLAFPSFRTWWGERPERASLLSFRGRKKKKVLMRCNWKYSVMTYHIEHEHWSLESEKYT